MPLFSNEPKKCLGVDIGSTSIKIVELTRTRNGISLSNYGIASIRDITGRELRRKTSDDFISSVDIISEAIQIILKEADIKTKRSVFAIPDFTSFFTSFEVPKMEKSEVESAIQFQARQRVPLPLNQVTLDWTLTGIRDSGEQEMVEVLLLAVPNETVNSYRNVAKKTGLDAGLLDAETSAFAKVYGRKNETVAVIDIGDKSTTVNIIEDEIPKHSHSLDIAGKDFTEDFAVLPEIERTEKAVSQTTEKIKKSLSEDLVSNIIDAIGSYEAGGKKVDEVILTGGGANFREIRENLGKHYKISIANPFQSLDYPSILEEVLKKDLSPLCSVAVGMAMEGLNLE